MAFTRTIIVFCGCICEWPGKCDIVALLDFSNHFSSHVVLDKEVAVRMIFLKSSINHKWEVIFQCTIAPQNCLWSCKKTTWSLLTVLFMPWKYSFRVMVIMHGGIASRALLPQNGLQSFIVVCSWLLKTEIPVIPEYIWRQKYKDFSDRKVWCYKGFMLYWSCHVMYSVSLVFNLEQHSAHIY